MFERMSDAKQEAAAAEADKLEAADAATDDAFFTDPAAVILGLL